MRNHREFARTFVLTVVTTLGLMIAGSASAVDLTLNVDAVFTSGFGPAPAVVTPGSITGLLPGDIIQLSIDIANPTNELILALFATLTIDPSIIGLNVPFSSFLATILNVPGTGPPVVTVAQSLGAVGTPAIKAASLPAGDQIQAVAFGSVAGSNGAGPETGAATIFLDVTGPGMFDVTLGLSFANDLINIAGVESFGAAAGALVSVANPVITITVPEPSSFAAGLAGLTTVVGIASVRRRRE